MKMTLVRIACDADAGQNILVEKRKVNGKFGISGRIDTLGSGKIRGNIIDRKLMGLTRKEMLELADYIKKAIAEGDRIVSEAKKVNPQGRIDW